jgi:hypothetical protein
MALVRLDALALLPDMQVRTRTNPSVVEGYRRAMAAGAQFPPIRVANVGGALILTDGFHRVTAMRALNWSEVEAAVFEAANLDVARWDGGRANLSHGLRLTRTDRREVFRAYVKAGAHRTKPNGRGRVKSYREMSADLPGFPHTTLRNWMRADFPSVYRALGSAQDEVRNSGGLRSGLSPERTMLAEALGAVSQAAALVDGLRDPTARWAVLERAEALVERLKEAGVEPPPF